MKKYLYLLLLALVPAMTFTACGSDDDELDPENVNQDDVQISKPTLKETANQIILTYNESYGNFVVNMVETYEFQGERLVKVTFSETFPSEKLAKQFMEEIQKDPEEAERYKNISRSGRTITYDATAEFQDYTKSQIKEMLQWRMEEWDHMNEFK